VRNRTIFRTRRRRARWRRLLTFCVAFLAVTTTASALIESGSKSVSQPRAHAARGPHLPRRPAMPKPAPVRPLQFLVVSFDGSGGNQLWPYWRNVARRAGAHFTFFVSGVYLLDVARRDLYHPPRHDVGYSAIGFAQPMDGLSAGSRIRETLQQIGLAYREGNEIGTHFNGHFCAPFPGSVGEWTSADWSSELDQFRKLMFDASANNLLRPAVRLPFGPSEVVGERTPCLQGDMHALLPVLAARGFRYDASQIGRLWAWPYRQLGVWELPLQLIPFVGHTYRVVSMDYNFFYNQAIAGLSAAGSEQQTYLSLWRAFRSSYYGNRAPLSFANHFETWNGWAYDHALARVVLQACRLPEVRCVSFRELTDWLDAQPPARLQRYERGRFPRLHVPRP
jgi:hypothetical protein